MLDQQVTYLEQERVRAERQKLKEVNEYRAALQNKTQARDYDLSDPNMLKTSQPARVGDDDPRMTVSGMQKFYGEDLSYAHRAKAQREEIKQWADLQLAEKAAKAALASADESAYAQSMMEIDAMKGHLEDSAAMARKNTAKALAEYQLAQAAGKKEKER